MAEDCAGSGGWGSWCVFATLLCCSGIVLVLEWKEECDEDLQVWLLTAISVTAFCGVLGIVFHGKGDVRYARSRFLDDDSLAVDRELEVGLDLNRMESGESTQPTPSVSGGNEVEEETGPASMISNSTRGEESFASNLSSRTQLASRASASLQQQYFGPGPKVYPDAVFLLLVVSQWFLAGWSVVGAIIYVRLFRDEYTCSPLLRHWTLLIVIIGFLSCLLTACYSGIMCCMLGSISGTREKQDEGKRFDHSQVNSNVDGMT